MDNNTSKIRKLLKNLVNKSAKEKGEMETLIEKILSLMMARTRQFV